MLKNIYYSLILLGFSLLLIRWKKLDRRVWVFSIILPCAFLTEKIGDIFHGTDISKYVFHIYQVVEMLLLSFYYYTLFHKKRNQWVVVIGAALFCIYFLYFYVFNSANFFTDKRNDMTVEGFLLTIFSVLFFLEIYQQDSPVILLRYTHFWIVLANLLFFSGSLFFSGYLYYLLSNKSKDYVQLSYIMVALNYILYIFYAIAFICHPKQRESD